MWQSEAVLRRSADNAIVISYNIPEG